MKKAIFFCLMALLGGTTGIQAQFAQPTKPKDLGIKSKKAFNLYLEGRQQEQWRDWEKAKEAYYEALELEPNFSYAHFRLGVVHTVRQEFAEGLPHLEKVEELAPGEFGGIGFYLGQCYFFNGKYEESIPWFKAYLEEGRGGPSYVKTVQLNLRKAAFAAEAVKNPVPFEPENMGPQVNSPEDDYTPCLTADGQMLLFTSRREGSTGGFSRRLNSFPEDFYFCIQDLEGNWKPAINLGSPINTPLNEGVPYLGQDGTYLLFSGCNREDGYGSCDLYESNFNGTGWSQPQNLGPNVNSRSWDSHPSLSHDGKRLYFASNRPGGKGGRDLWYCERTAKGWGPAQNLGEPVNTEGNDELPFLHADGQTLYFVSDYHLGFGNADIFLSRRRETGNWGFPKNLGWPLNSPADEGYLFVNTQGNRGYLNSTREGGVGRSDLYTFPLPEAIRPQTATFVRGLVRDSLTQKPLKARIRLLDVATGDTVRTIFSDAVSGRFLMSLPMNRSYAAIVERPKYLFASKNFFLQTESGETYYDLTLDLVPLQPGKQVVLRNIFFETGSYELQPTSEPELNVLLSYLKRNRRMQIEIQGHTDDVGSDADNLQLSQDRAESVRAYLVDKGISPERIEAKGFGETQPISTNETDEGRAQNRRTEFRVIGI
ncbi:MAG: OmpA family protein [Bacteroidota bacterium]